MANRIVNRRNFLSVSSTGMVGSLLTSSWMDVLQSMPKTVILSAELTIQQVLDLIIQQIPGDTSGPTVDTIKIGNPDQVVSGIVSTFMATIEVIHQTIDLGANLIITHEPTFYNHLDNTDWLSEDPVYRHKKDLLEKHEIVVWRFHDFWHRHRPDGILTGFLKAMAWEDYLDDSRENVCVIPPTTLSELATSVKNRFQLKRTFYIGDAHLRCTKVGILPGAWGGRAHIPFLAQDIDVLLVGESAEWEAVEYVRDASQAGFKKGMIIMGHARSEQPGMEYLVEWLSHLMPEIRTYHVAAGDPLTPV